MMTLGDYRRLTAMLFGEGSPQHKFITDKIASQGEAAEVLADETQMLALFAQMEDTKTMRTRVEHLEWCKERALEYLDRGDVQNAIASMLSDLRKHPELEYSANPHLALIGMTIAADGDVKRARNYIEGFR